MQKRARALRIRSTVAGILLVPIIGAIIWLFATGELSIADFTGNLELLGLTILLSLGLLFSLLPGIIAFRRRARNRVAILVLSLLLGFTLLGWIVAFVWAFVDKTEP